MYFVLHFTCWAVYGGHYLTMIAAQAFVLDLYMPKAEDAVLETYELGISSPSKIQSALFCVSLPVIGVKVSTSFC